MWQMLPKRVPSFFHLRPIYRGPLTLSFLLLLLLLPLKVKKDGAIWHTCGFDDNLTRKRHFLIIILSSLFSERAALFSAYRTYFL